MPVVAIKTFLIKKTSTKSPSKVKLKVNSVNYINYNLQLCCDTTSFASLLIFRFLTAMTSFNVKLVTTLF